MAYEDGSVVIVAKMEVDKAQKDLSKLQRDIEKTEKKIEGAETKRNPIVEQLKEAKNAAVEAQNTIDRLKKSIAEGGLKTAKPEDSAELREQERILGQLESYAVDLERKDAKLVALIEEQRGKLAEQVDQAGRLAKEIEEASSGSRRMADAQEKAEKNMRKFASRLKEIVKSALVFTVITQSLAAFRDWMGKVIRTNAEASGSIARLKGALLTLAQPLVQIIIPAFTTFVNVLTAVVGRVAQLVSALFGSTAEEASNAASALHEEAEALNETGSAAKKASKSLASFDEINKLSDGDSSGGGGASASSIAPDFSWSEGVSGFLRQIADDVLVIAAGLALWRISGMLPETLGGIAAKIAGLAVAVGGLMLLWDGLSDAWKNGVDWGNMASMIAGVSAAAGGLYLALGKVGAGVSLVVGGVLMLISGFKDMMENGMDVENMLLSVAGIIATGLGITLLTGSLIPLLVSGIASILLAIVQLTGNGGQLIDNLKRIFAGLVTFVQGLVEGDLQKVVDGLKNTAKGAVNLVLTIVGSLVNAIISGLNWLVSKINTINFDIPDWIPGVGGKSIGFNIQPIEKWNIPQLATGAVIPPNREFLAVLGDQSNGTNIEAPLSTIEQALENVLNRRGGTGEQTAVMECDKIQFAKLIYRLGNSETARHGVSLTEVR